MLRFARLTLILTAVLVGRIGLTQVVIDAGHGGNDAGATGFWQEDMVFEKDLTFAASVALAEALELRGIYAYQARQGDQTLPLSERVARATRHCPGGLFISLHVDTFTDSQTTSGGMRFFSLNDRGIKQTLPEDVNPKRLTRYREHAERVSAQMMNYLHDAQWRYFAKIERRNFQVLHNTACPAILVELGMMNNKHDMAWLNDPDRLAQRMDGLAQAVQYYLQSEKEL
ncbi:N-acetylmuramoyl-L-alanine amidase [Suttonella sp. R2A3]|uniref:N-acetylmuramoyl-L-alanine amidase n=1 Tax=Suttonella sp. R2A3 TaxID=2908648 RepID=UPI001F2B92B0|nr:N-acetylmuramoyl-L-alanine amidase [Suttonella sp. R2A3]UJF24361.1 N-acetylmuramoyl-L-alanine amidase [Suttonella sp. R2A3]